MIIYDIFRFDNFEFVDGEQGHTKIKALLKLKNTSIERIFNAPIKPFDQTWIECISEDLYCSPAKLWIVRIQGILCKTNLPRRQQEAVVIKWIQLSKSSVDWLGYSALRLKPRGILFRVGKFSACLLGTKMREPKHYVVQARLKDITGHHLWLVFLARC